MSDTTSTSAKVAPATNQAVKDAQGFADLVNAVASDPEVAADFGAQFATISHSPIVQSVASGIIALAAQGHVTVSSGAASFAAAVLVLALGYGWQWASMKMTKPTKPS